MKKTKFSAIVLSILYLFVSAPTFPQRATDADGFASIFDGKTLSGWRAVPRESASDWSVRNGAIVGHGSADRLAYLVWKDEHLTDFELKLRYRLPGNGNTGVEIRSQPDLTGKRPFEGYHADLGHVGIGPHVLGAWDFHFARRKEYPCPRGTRLVIDEDGKPHSSSIRGALTVADIRPHQWNDVRIIARGNHFQFFINGKLASEFTDNAKSGRLDHGAIGLQIHEKGNDLMKHPTAWKTIADKITVEDPKKEKNPWGNPRLQFNWLTTWIYEGVYFAPMNVYTMDQSDFFDGFDYETRHEKDVLDFYIGTSRDGMNFDKSWIYARKPLVPRGPAGSFDKDCVFPPSQFVTHKDEHWIFYGAASERHYSIGRDMKIGLAKLRLDGFICLEAKDTPGTVVTKAFKLEGDKLEVNVDAKDGWVQVELLDENSKVIPGFSGKAAKQYKGVDELRLKPKWKSGGDLSQLKPKTVRLRFTLQNARLYSFSFKQMRDA